MNAATDQLTILLDRDDLACLEALLPGALAGRLMVMDIDLHLVLLDRGIEHLTPSDIVKHDEYDALRRFDADVLAFWERSAQAIYDGLDCLRLARYRHMCCFTRLAWAAYVIRRTIESLRPREVVTFEENYGHGLDQPAGNRKMPLLFALVRGMAEQAGLAVRLLRRGDVPGQKAFTDGVAPAAAIRLPPVAANELLGDRPYVLFTGSGLDLARQVPVIRSLRREGTTVVQLYKSADESTLGSLRREGHLLWHESQVAHPQVRSAECGVRSIKGEARREFDRHLGDAPAELRCIFANRYMDIHFDFIFGEYLERMAWHVRTWKAFFARNRPEVLVANYPAPIVDIAHHLGIPCLLLTHGLMILGDTRLYEGQPPVQIGAVSEAHRSRLIDAAIEPGRIHVVGDPGADELVRRAGLRIEKPSQCTSGKTRATRRRILLVTGELSAPSAKACLPEADFAAAVCCFDQLAELIARRGEWDFAIKCHPRYDHPALHERMNRRLPAERRIPVFMDHPLEELVKQADVAVFPNARSSALLEASMWDRPVIILDTCMIWFDHALWGTDRWPRVRSVADLETELDALFGDDHRYQDRVAESRDALAYSLGRDLGRSAERVDALIEQLAELQHAKPSLIPSLRADRV